MTKPPLTDTSAEALAVQTAAYRHMTPARKLRIVRELSNTANQLALAGLRLRYPDASHRELLLRLGAITLGAETVARVYGWRPPGHDA